MEHQKNEIIYQLIQPSFWIDEKFNLPYEIMVEKVETYARKCYRSEPKSDKFEDREKFIKGHINHKGIFGQADLSINFVIDRGVSHELVRHRPVSILQESTRYVNFKKVGIEFIKPHWFGLFNFDNTTETPEDIILETAAFCEKQYNKLIEKGIKPQDARWVLPNGLRTTLVVTANIEEWRWILQLRTKPDCHPEMVKIMTSLLDYLKKNYRVFFEDINSSL